jgi:hypothetical protein
MIESTNGLGAGSGLRKLDLGKTIAGSFNYHLL